ncbi:plastocyanin [Natronococcus sp. A-GB1]|uniref:plastocyanin/azurin family copper-binding protein n=1 Tax=Natronococcus sp. A-GB1 TaxID=3037648 RepID=UPI00241CD08B|nr:plastocyanin/azurin family copper-binding protein [Natronococcus sp. A-GB1]MDG5760371.1 plastocyanin [Natronococcus sp. A-GB1]
MRQPVNCSRRQALGLTGATAMAALAAGCLGGGETSDENGDVDDDSGDDGNESRTEAPDSGSDDGEDPIDGGNDDDAETSEPNPDDEDEDDGSRDRRDAWADTDEIVLSATTAGWKGVKPEPIEDEKNPAIVLEAGREYVLSWENEDGQPHNIEIWDESGERVDNYGTELMETEGATQSLEFEASAEMAEYVCEIHAGWEKRGRIEIKHP